MSKSNVPQLRKGLTRDDLLEETWVKLAVAKDGFNVSSMEMEAVSASMGLLDHLLDMVNRGDRVTRKDVTAFFGMIETFTKIREVINRRIGDGKLTPSLLDEMVK